MINLLVSIIACDVYFTVYKPRSKFSQWLLVKCASNPNFVAYILFTDEALFTRNGITNFHNDHVWAEENPHALIQTNHQHRFSLRLDGHYGGIMILTYKNVNISKTVDLPTYVY